MPLYEGMATARDLAAALLRQPLSQPQSAPTPDPARQTSPASSTMSTQTGTFPIGIVVDGVRQTAFELRSVTVGDNVDVIEELGDVSALRLSAALYARQLVALGSLPKERITSELVLGYRLAHQQGHRGNQAGRRHRRDGRADDGILRQSGGSGRAEHQPPAEAAQALQAAAASLASRPPIKVTIDGREITSVLDQQVEWYSRRQ